VFFRLTFDVSFFALLRDQPLELSIASANATVRFEQAKKDNLADDAWRCVVSREQEPNQQVREMFEGILNGTIDPAKDWERFGVRKLELLGPPPYRSLVDSVQNELTDIAHRCITVTQWRLGLRGSHQPLHGWQRLWWSFDGNNWQPIKGLSGSVAGDSMSLTNMKQRAQEIVIDLLEAGEREPLGHELLREAMSLRRSGSRSAFVVALMAAEIGVKQCIAELLPQTEWLMMHVPTPPLLRLIQEQLPLVPAKCKRDGSVVPVPKEICDTLRSAVSIRNDLVHKGRHDKAEERLGEVIGAVRSLLYLLDYYRGHEWAMACVGSSP
jgi:hypothetical protein